eukprot:366004-Chlamydomonas_euryale.AAC.4
MPAHTMDGVHRHGYYFRIISRIISPHALPIHSPTQPASQPASKPPPPTTSQHTVSLPKKTGSPGFFYLFLLHRLFRTQRPSANLQPTFSQPRDVPSRGKERCLLRAPTLTHTHVACRQLLGRDAQAPCVRQSATNKQATLTHPYLPVQGLWQACQASASARTPASLKTAARQCGLAKLHPPSPASTLLLLKKKSLDV